MSKPPPNNSNNAGPPVSEAPKDAQTSKPRSDRSNRGRGRGRGGRFQPYQQPPSFSCQDGADLAPKPPEKPIGTSKAGPTVGRSAYMGYPRKLRYTVYCSNAGTRSLVSAVWRSIQDRDPKMAQRVTGPQLLYVVNVAFVNRLVRNAILVGYGPLFNEASRLKQAAEGIILPAVLCDYVEALGTITMASSATVVPWVDVADRLFAAPGFIPLRNLLQEGGRPQPPPDDVWGLDKDWIDAWNEVTSRPASKSMHMRTILWSATAGSTTQLVTPTEWDVFRRCTPSAIQNCYNHELQLGATYNFRSYEDAMAWPGDTSDIAMDMFRGEPFEPDSFWSQLVVASFRTPTL